MKRLLLWVRITRPQTLFASLCPVLVGLVVVAKSGIDLDGATAAVTAISALALQILSNLINDYYDFERGTDRKGRKGFKRALAEGEVTPRQMLTACCICAAVALLTGVYLAVVGGWPIVAIGATALLFAWLYTATNHSLSYLGVADLFVYLYYGIIATMGTVWLQTLDGNLLRQAFWAGSVCGICSMCVLNINNIRDLDDDRRANKRTFPVRFGKRAAEWSMFLLIILAPTCAYLAFGSWITVCIAVPLLMLFGTVRHAQGAQYNRCLLLAGLCNAIYVVLAWIA